MAQLKLRVLGRFEAFEAGKPITKFETNKIRALLAYLAVEASQVHSRESLMGLLWPDSPQSAAMESLRHALATLRKTVGDQLALPPFLLITRETVQLNRQSNVRADVWDFQQALARKSSSNNLELSIAFLKSAIDLYRGPFLDGLYCGSDVFENWAQTRREGLNRQVHDALSELAILYAETGEYEESIMWARRLLELEPWDETAYRLVMAGLARRGERNAALAQYETCREFLKKELNVEPEPATQRLYEAIRNGGWGIAASQESAGRSKTVSPFDPGSVAASMTQLLPLTGIEKFVPQVHVSAVSSPPTMVEMSRHILPASWPQLIGREHDLEEIADRLNDPACRLLTLVGPGGIGKTHLALEAVARQADNFHQGVYFVSLAPLQSVDAVPPAIAQALGFTFYSGGEPIQELLDYLRKKELLLLLDNFEHLRQGAGLLTAILQAAPQVKIVVTSRARLNLLDEYLFTVEGLDYPGPSFQSHREYSAVKLFFESARRVQPHFQVVESDWEAVGKICWKVQGIPLAILLAAGWMGTLSPAEILQEIENRSLDFLEADWQDVSERQRSMRVVFDGSFKLLSPSEQDIFAELSVFRGGFTLSTAQAVTGVSLHELRALVDKCLVQRGSAGRYYLHELLRQYGEEILNRSPNLDEIAHDRHCAYFVAALASWWKDHQGSRQFTAIKELAVELENALAAWDWMAERIQVERMRQAVFGLLNGLLLIYGELLGTEVGRHLCQQAAEKLAPLVLPAPAAFADGARLLASLWINRPSLNFQFLDQEYTFLQRSEILLDQLAAAGQDTRLEQAMLLKRRGVLSSQAGQMEEVSKLFGKSLNLFRELGDDYRAGQVLIIWGFTCALLGSQRKGFDMLKESIAIEQRLGDRISMSKSLSNLRETIWLMMQGSFDEQERLVREYLSSCLETGNSRLIASAKGELGAILIRQGKFAEAYPVLVESFAALDQLGAVAESYFYGLYLSEAQIHLGQVEQAYARCQAILPFYRKNDQFVMMGYNLILLGWAALGLEKYTEARQYLEEAALIEPELRYNDRALCLASLCYAERRLGRPAQAVSYFFKAVKIGMEKQMAPVFYLVLPAAALILIDQGKIERALEVYALAMRFSYVDNSRWFAAVAWREIAARAGSLSGEVIATVQARGRARDLMATAEELLSEFLDLFPVV
jgi:predicted ATPase/DNA-binding SARP family transcriptional activator